MIMKKLIYIMLPALVLFNSGCTKEDTAEDLQDKIIGTWNWNSFTYVDANPAFNVSGTNSGTITFNSSSISYSNTSTSDPYYMVSGTDFDIHHPRTEGGVFIAHYTVSEITENSLKFSASWNDTQSELNGTASYVLSK
jgi:hypothetical protein